MFPPDEEPLPADDDRPECLAVQWRTPRPRPDGLFPFAALADPTLRAILARLASGEASVNELARPFDMSQPAISKHLKVPQRAGLISRGRDAQRRPCRLSAQPLADANEWLERYRKFWEASLARLDDLLEEMKAEQQAQSKSKRKGAKR